MKKGWPDAYLTWTDTRGHTHVIPYWYGEWVKVMFNAPDDPPEISRQRVEDKTPLKEKC